MHHRAESRAHRTAVAIAAMVTAVFTGAVSAQAPVITPKGDPSVKDDTIYSLLVKAADHPEESTVMLLDDGVLRFDKDGTGTRTYRSVVQLLKQNAVEGWSEQTISYDGDREEFTLNWARVIDADGKVVSDAPLHVQELDAPVPEGSPIYTHQKQVRISLSSVAQNRIVDFSYTIRVKKPILTGDYGTSWRITTLGTVRRSRFIVDLAADSKARIIEKNLNFKPVVERPTGRVVRTWYVADQQYVRPQLFASDTNSILQHIAASGESDWQTIASWYAGLARDRYAATPWLKTWLDSATATAKTPREKLVLVHRAITQDVRYVSLSLGIGGFQPRMPADVLKTSSGDCKDKATTFVTLARALGFEAYPILVSASQRVDEKLPTTTAFDHEIAGVKIGNAWTYVDLTDPFTPFGDAVDVMDDDIGLLVRDDGKGEIVHFAAKVASQNMIKQTVTGSIDETGRFNGVSEVTGTGANGYKIRATFPDSLTAEQIIQAKGAMARTVFEGATGDSVDISRGLDLSVQPHVRVKLSAQPVKTMDDGAILKLPIQRTEVSQVVAQLEQEKERRFWFNAGSLIGSQETRSEFHLTLPAGWSIKLPAAVHATSAFGTYDATFEQTGTDVHIIRDLRGARGLLPPAAKADLITWLKEITKDDTDFLVLKHAAK